jgi:DNA modification methylase
MQQYILGDSRKALLDLEDASVDCVYMDPPFNSDANYRLGPDSDLGFDDKFESSSAYARVIEPIVSQCARALKDNGSLFFHISAEQMLVPQMICVKHFKKVQPIFWKKSRSKNNVKNKLGATIDVIFWCTNSSKPKFNMVHQPLDEYYAKNSYKNKDDRGNYALGHVVYTATQKTSNKDRLYSIEHDGTVYAPKNGWRLSKEDLMALIADNRIHFPSKTGANPYKKIYKHESKGKPCTDLWDDIHSIAQGSETRQYPTQKPVSLLKRIIQLTTDEGDVILDPVAGSGTTGVAASTLNRNFILIDKNRDALEICKRRVKKEGNSGL